MSENPANPESRSGSHEASDGDEINVLDLAIVIAKHKKLVIGVPLIAAVVAAGISLLLPNIYTGVSRILPPQQNQSTAAAMLNQFGTLAGIAGQSLGVVRNPSDLYVGMLKSRTIADNLIARFDLKTIFDSKYESESRKTLESMTRVAAGRDSIIVIEVEDKDPGRAADLANGYVEELTKLTGVLAVTEASQRRLFFERQLALARQNLSAAEIATRQGLEKGGLAKVDEQGRAMIEVTARLRGQISVKEVQINSMRAFATDRNPELRMAQQELDALKRELARIEGESPQAGPGKTDAITNTGLDNLRRLRDMKYYETVYELLAKQYEIAKIDEARDAGLIQVLDKAVPADRKSRPKRAVIVIVTALVAGFLAVLWAFFREAEQRVRQNPQQAERLNTLRRYLLGK